MEEDGCGLVGNVVVWRLLVEFVVGVLEIRTV